MGSKLKTAWLGLNQWLGNENVRRQDFVDDNKAIEEAIDGFDAFCNKPGTVLTIEQKGNAFYLTAVNGDEKAERVVEMGEDTFTITSTKDEEKDVTTIKNNSGIWTITRG